MSGGDYTGGLVGANYTVIDNSFSQVTVKGVDAVGGLVGLQEGGSTSDSYATGNVSGTGNGVGGLMGQTLGALTTSYAAGAVTGTTRVGGGDHGQRQRESQVGLQERLDHHERLPPMASRSRFWPMSSKPAIRSPADPAWIWPRQFRTDK